MSPATKLVEEEGIFGSQSRAQCVDAGFMRPGGLGLLIGDDDDEFGLGATCDHVVVYRGDRSPIVWQERRVTFSG